MEIVFQVFVRGVFRTALEAIRGFGKKIEGVGMRYLALLIVFCMGCVAASGEITRKEMKKLGNRIEVDSVRTRTVKSRSKGKIEVIELEFSSEEEDQSDLLFRVAVEVMDGDKRLFLITDTHALRDTELTSSDYSGNGYFKMEVPYGSFTKLKVTACAFELGIMDGDTFVAFDGDYDHVKSYDELVQRTTVAFPGDRCRMGQTLYVSSD